MSTAGVGLAWYTWLEQACEIEVSAHFLDCIVQALTLDATERAQLFTLAHNRPPLIVPDPSLAVTPHLRRMLDAVMGPAYLATASMHLIAWNDALLAVFGDLSMLARFRVEFGRHRDDPAFSRVDRTHAYRTNPCIASTPGLAATGEGSIPLQLRRTWCRFVTRPAPAPRCKRVRVPPSVPASQPPARRAPAAP